LAKANGLIAAKIGLTTVIKARYTILGASLKHLLAQIIIKIVIEKVKRAGLVNRNITPTISCERSESD